MKAEILLMMFASLCIGERQQRSTVLTDESKRVLEHFDFSNFDKQEALNNIERQRYENQIRGKRSQTKFKKNDNEENSSEIMGTETEQLEKERNDQPQQEGSVERESHENEYPNVGQCKRQKNQDSTVREVRPRVGRRFKKRKYKLTKFADDEDNKVNEMKGQRKKRRKKKKKKRKRRYWDKWSEWSPCSVTCGRGRKIRWRKCIAKNCNTGELEMGEKTCQLPACNLLTKILGL